MIEFQNLSFTYPGVSQPILRHINLTINKGEFTLVTGASGSGKSTLLRCLNGLVPHFSGGSLQGAIRVAGLDPVQSSPQVMCRHVGFVFQDPETQFVVDRVEDEIAFALENAALPRKEMHERVRLAMEWLHLESLRKRRLETLSGGERQRVAIASALVFQPRILVLDEPTSQLDPQSAEDVLQVLESLKKNLGLTIVLAEHRLERVLPFTDRLVYLPGGEGEIIQGEPRQVLERMPLRPPLAELAVALGWKPIPLTIEEAQPFLTATISLLDPPPTPQIPTAADAASSPRTPYLKAAELSAHYGKHQALQNVNLEVRAGEILALMGANGAGKSTLLRAMVGLIKPTSGQIWLENQPIELMDTSEICRHVGFLPQDPNALLFADTVLDELKITLHNHDISRTDAQLVGFLEQIGLASKYSAYPRDLSSGERQRVALGAVTVTQPGALLLDEPTRGLDYQTKVALSRLLERFRTKGMAILIVTHDVEMAATIADRVAILEQGRIAICDHPARALSHSPLFLPQMARLFPSRGWLKVQDVLAH